MLKYRADIRSIGFVVCYFLLTVLLWIWFYELPLFILVPAIALLCTNSFICAIIVHNTVHVPIFKSKLLNSIFQFILSFTYGHSVSGFVAGHNFSHHKHMATSKDIARTSKLRFKWNLLNQALFFTWTSASILKTEVSWALKMKKERPAWFYQYAIELIAVYGLKFGMLFVDYKLALLLLFLPHQSAQWGIVGTNYWQHDGCDTDHPYNHSRNFNGKILNFFFLNNGFHGLHHDQPCLHWSLLPEVYYQDYVQHVHPNLNRKSLAVYWFESYIYPGKRVDYLGNPVVLVPKEHDIDEDWVYDTVPKDHKDDFGAVSD